MALFTTLKKHKQKYRSFLLFYLALALIVSVSSVVTIRLSGEMGQAALGLDTGTLLRFLGVITAITLLRAVASAVSALMLGRFAAKAGYRFRDNFAQFFLQRPFASFEGENSGESASVFTTDLPMAVDLVSRGGIRMMADIISLVVSFVYMLTLNPWLTLVFFVLFPVLVAMQILLSLPIQKVSKMRLEARAKFNAIVTDSLQNTSTITAYSLEQVLETRYLAAYETYMTALRKFARNALSLILGGIVATLTPQIIVTVVAANAVINGNMLIGEFIAFLALSDIAGEWLAMLSQQLNGVQTQAAGAKRLNAALDGAIENLSDGKGLTSDCDTVVSMDSLSFSYNDDTPALENINLKIDKGERVALVGGSGSGKSTVVKLLLGLYPPKEGKINIMGEDIESVSKNALRNVFAYVPQDSFLFPESIGENITGEKIPTDKPRLEKACRDAGIWDFIQGLPNKFDSELNESAENISGGQKQRIALARAFYRDARVILFDEATSALDPATEAEIFKSFGNLARDKTVIMVAHRPKAIAFCDKIIVMDSGRISAIGGYDELLAKGAL